MPEGGDNETEEFNIEFALLGIRVQLVFLKASKNLANMDFSFFGILRKDENVVQMYYCEFIEDINKNNIREALESGGRVGKVEVLDYEGCHVLNECTVHELPVKDLSWGNGVYIGWM